MATLEVSKSDLVDFLTGVPLLASCTKADLRQIANAATTSHFHANQAICRQGTVGDDFYIILKGEVRVIVNVHSHSGLHKHVVAELGPGKYFGEQALVQNGLRTADVIANTDTQCLRMSRDAFLNIMSPLARVQAQILEWGKDYKYEEDLQKWERFQRKKARERRSLREQQGGRRASSINTYQDALDKLFAESSSESASGESTGDNKPGRTRTRGSGFSFGERGTAEEATSA
ncbi:MAG: hypothetical protein MHM6MM_002707 [Cercozoa sp. M6MM]